jgi:hypothetical protein
MREGEKERKCLMDLRSEWRRRGLRSKRGGNQFLGVSVIIILVFYKLHSTSERIILFF